jgi:mono/diheme cytochrome c family protein
MLSFFYKSLVSLLMIPSAIIALFTMFEIFGRDTIKYSVPQLKLLHKINGLLFIILFLYLTYLCLNFLMATKVELSSRVTFHSLFSLTIITLLVVKISFIRFYKKFYGQARVLGLVIALTTFGMVGTSGIYYLLVSEFGTDNMVARAMQSKIEKQTTTSENKPAPDSPLISTDAESITRGKNLFEESCAFCHDPYSTNSLVGPGLKGILKNPALPSSKRPSTFENIAAQFKTPYKRMPPFPHLSQDQVVDLISFLNTL